MLREILGHVGVAPELADAIVDWIDADADLSGSGGAEDAYYLGLQRPYRAANRPMVQLEELYRVRGFDAAAVAKLRPWVSALPTRTATNVNTAGDVVIAALLGVGRDRAAVLVAERRAKAFQQKADFAARIALLGPAAAIPDYDVKSSHFLIHVRVAQDDVQLSTEALVRRVESGATDIIWRRPRY
jgi:general secretion pathway protein K